jgi:MFS family permease
VLAGSLVAVAWQFPFFLYGVALVGAVAVYALFDEPASSTDHPATDGAAPESLLRQLWRVVGQLRVLSIIVSMVAVSFVYIGFLTYVSFIIIDKGGTSALAGGVVAVTSIVFATVSTQVGRLVGLAGNRVYPLIAANVFQGSGIVFIVFAPTLWLVFFGVLVLGVGQGLINPLFRSLITDIAPSNLRGTLVSFAESIGRVGGALGPTLMGSVIAVLSQQMRTPAAIRWTVAGTASLFTTIVIVFLVVALYAPPIRSPHSDKPRDVL